MIWKYGIFCAILSGSAWGIFWQIILTILGILTTGLQLSLEIAPSLFSGALIGLALPLASSLSASGSIYEIIVWGFVAIIIQLFCFKAVDILINDLPKRIENGEISSSILLFSIKISVALLNSAAISG